MFIFTDGAAASVTVHSFSCVFPGAFGFGFGSPSDSTGNSTVITHVIAATSPAFFVSFPQQKRHVSLLFPQNTTLPRPPAKYYSVVCFSHRKKNRCCFGVKILALGSSFCSAPVMVPSVTVPFVAKQEMAGGGEQVGEVSPRENRKGKAFSGQRKKAPGKLHFFF